MSANDHAGQLVRNIQRRMDELGVSKRRLALEMGVPRSSVIRWLNGTHVPDHVSVLRIAEALQTPWQWFYEAHETPDE